VEALAGVLGATTLAGLARFVGALGRVVAVDCVVVVVVVAALGGGACEIICAILLSLMKRPWPGGQVK
jgi:hypothetical protein